MTDRHASRHPHRTVGGARPADELGRKIPAVLGCTQQVFGMAEGLHNYTRLDESDEVNATTQGRPMCPDDEVLLVDDLDRPVPYGEPGSLLTRGGGNLLVEGRDKDMINREVGERCASTSSPAPGRPRFRNRGRERGREFRGGSWFVRATITTSASGIP